MINKNILKIFNPKKNEKIKYLDLGLRPAELKPDIYYKITELYERRITFLFVVQNNFRTIILLSSKTIFQIFISIIM